MKIGSETATKATADIQNAAQHPKLKQALERGSHTSKKWAERIARGLEDTGGSEQQEENFVIEGLDKVNQKILQTTSDSDTRDLGLIAAGQLALHY